MKQTQDTSKNFKSGFVTIVGAPNVGKSTLLNKMLGEKISITSKKAQTTRNRIAGVVHRPSTQLVFIDTPGVHRATSDLNVRMVDVAISAMGDVDMILFMIDPASPDPDSEQILSEKFKKLGKPVICAINKTDLSTAPDILKTIEKWSNYYKFAAVVPISAKKGDQIEALVSEMEALLPKGPPYFPEDSITDMPERFIVAEMVREKVFRFTGQEIPYSTAVSVESFKENAKTGLISIHATIHLERDSQKGIVIGKQGSKLKQIGEDARKEIERFLNAKVFLKLFVRIQKNWSKDTRSLRKFGY